MSPRVRRGNVTVEFVFALGILLPLLAGIVDASRYMVQWQSVSRIARDGGRQASGVPLPAGADDSTAESILTARVVPLIASTVVESGYACDDCATLVVNSVPIGSKYALREFRVRVAVPFAPLFGLLDLPFATTATYVGATDRQDLDLDFDPVPEE